MASGLYRVAYRLHGEAKSFIIRADKMDNTEAWHWASCDVGVGRIPRYGRERTKRVTIEEAQRFGITEVSWRSCERVVMPS
ncbi:DUF6555 family protein [Pseudomonas sp. nanlin1]|uniref:DUF6555 family protein n=1 Tax=Pseudomonas sp. nanlin1 TaxID=3040605 RepID=UPI00388FACCE